jgi:hypothetical protein
MKTAKQAGRTRPYGILSSILVATALWMPLAVSAQEEPKRALSKNGKGWKVNVISDQFAEKAMVNLQAKVEEDRLVCLSGGSVALEVPLKGISRMSRDTVKDYPVANFLMEAATQPSSERRRFGSKKYREEMAARATLMGFAFFALLFPKHKEEVHVFWIDEEGEHGAEFLMGRKEGRAMLQKLQQETGVKPRDLEKERKDFERKRKELQRRIKQHGKEGHTEQGTPQSDHPAC